MGQTTIMVKRMRSIRACNFDHTLLCTLCETIPQKNCLDTITYSTRTQHDSIYYPIFSSYEIRAKSIILFREHINNIQRVLGTGADLLRTIFVHDVDDA